MYFMLYFCYLCKYYIGFIVFLLYFFCELRWFFFLIIIIVKLLCRLLYFQHNYFLDFIVFIVNVDLCLE